jgi:hypothetical protein
LVYSDYFSFPFFNWDIKKFSKRAGPCFGHKVRQGFWQKTFLVE